MRSRSFRLLLLLLSILWGSGHVARAQQSGTSASQQTTAAQANCPNFADCYRQAIRLYKSEQIVEALAAFDAAYAFNPEPNLLINIGRAHSRLGRPQQALDYYERFLRAVPHPEASVRSRIDQYMAEARQALSTMPPPPAKTPDPAPDSPPPPAAAPAQTEPSSAAPLATAPLQSTTAPPTGPVASAVAPTPDKARAAPTEGRPIYKRWWFWGAIGLVVAGGVTAGVIAGLQSGSSANGNTAVDLGGIEVRKLRF